MIRKIIVNGKTAEKLYIKYIESMTGIKAIALPSTSPANAAWSLDRLTEAWVKEIRPGGMQSVQEADRKVSDCQTSQIQGKLKRKEIR